MERDSNQQSTDVKVFKSCFSRQKTISAIDFSKSVQISNKNIFCKEYMQVF